MKEDALIARVERAMLIAARLVEHRPLALLLFERLDEEHKKLVAERDARRNSDPIERARALLKARKAA